MTVKVMEYQEAVKHKGKPQQETRKDTEPKDDKPKVDEIPPECEKCDQYTEGGVFCMPCQRQYHFTCLPKEPDKILLLEGYVYQEHDGI